MQFEGSHGAIAKGLSAMSGSLQEQLAPLKSRKTDLITTPKLGGPILAPTSQLMIEMCCLEKNVPNITAFKTTIIEIL